MLYSISGNMHNRSQHPECSQQIHNIHHKDDIHYTMQICRWLLKPLGIWHLTCDHVSQYDMFITLVLIITCLSALFFVLVPSVLYTLFHEKDINVKIKLLGPVGFCLTCTIKYCYLGARAASFGKCIQHIEDDWRTVRDKDHREIMLKNALTSRRFSTLCALLLYFSGLTYHTIMPLSSRKKINGTLIRSLAYPGYDIFFDAQTSPAYEIVFCIHYLFALITYNVTTATLSLVTVFVTHSCGQLQILMTLLDDLVKGNRSKGTTVDNRLSKITRHHVRNLKFSNNVEEILHGVCLMELVTSTLTICLVEYYCIKEWENSDFITIVVYFILLLSFSFNILLFCYVGELLVEQYSKIGLAAYDTNWYDLSGNKAVYLVMIITMSHYSPKLTAGKFVDLSINTFGTIIKSSVVYLNFLRTITE